MMYLAFRMMLIESIILETVSAVEGFSYNFKNVGFLLVEFFTGGGVAI